MAMIDDLMIKVNQLLDRVTGLLGRRDLTQKEEQEWWAGTATGGPDGNGLYPRTDSTGVVRKLPSPAKIAETAAGSVTSRYSGAVPNIIRNWRDEQITPHMFRKEEDWVPAIQKALDVAHDEGAKSIYIPNDREVYMLLTPGEIPVHLDGTPENRVRGVIRLRPGVNITSNGAKLMIGPHDGFNTPSLGPPGMFYQNPYNDPICDNVRITGLYMDGNIENQTWKPPRTTGPGANGSTAYQFQHAIVFMRGKNITVDNCVFRGWRGDGCLFGNTMAPTKDLYLMHNIRVSHCEFKDVFREAVLFCAVIGGEFSHNYVHGDGYLVSAVDIERHARNDTVRDISVFDNLFDFRDGWGPMERDGPIPLHFRRAVSIGFFYEGHTPDPITGLPTADKDSSGHKVHHNTIYQGQIDCWRHTDVEISNNHFINYYEDTNGSRLIDSHAIKIDDYENTQGLGNIKVHDNFIDSDMDGNALFAFNQNKMSVKGNTIRSTRKNGIQMNFCGGLVQGNIVENVGTKVNRAFGIEINSCQPGGMAVLGNKILDTRNGVERTVLGGIRLASGMSKAPTVIGNEGFNFYSVPGVKPLDCVLNEGSDPSFASIWGNTEGNISTFKTNGDGVFGDAKGSKSIRVNGEVNQGSSLELMASGNQRFTATLSVQEAETGEETGSNLSMFLRKDNGAYGVNVMRVNRKTGAKDLSEGQVRIDGTFDKPLLMGAFTRIWMHPDGRLMRKFNAPTDEDDGETIGPFKPLAGSWQEPYIMDGNWVWYSAGEGLLRRHFDKPTKADDGRPIGPQPQGFYNTPLILGNYRLWVNPEDGKLYIKSSAPASATDGTVVGTQV